MRDSNKVRKIHPVGMRILVRLCKPEVNTSGGLYLPEGSKEEGKIDAILAEVLEVARAIDAETDEITNISGIPWGSFVLIPSNAGFAIPWDNNLRLVGSNDVLGTVEELDML